jgi:hypothetical protein
MQSWLLRKSGVADIRIGYAGSNSGFGDPGCSTDSKLAMNTLPQDYLEHLVTMKSSNRALFPGAITI